MQLLVAYQSDPAGCNMANYLINGMKKEGDIYRGKYFDLTIIPTPVISADWIETKYPYDGYVFLSKHASEAGIPALTCHSTGNFSDDNQFGGLPRQVAIPHSHIQKSYMQHLWQEKENFSKFEITIEATHHGPTSLNKPTIFIEVGTTENEWRDNRLCERVAEVVLQEISKESVKHEVAICFGGTHYPKKFNKVLIEGKLSLGTVMPKHALDLLDESLFSHILDRNREAKLALLDWSSLGKNKQRVINLIQETDLEMIKI